MSHALMRLSTRPSSSRALRALPFGTTGTGASRTNETVRGLHNLGMAAFFFALLRSATDTSEGSNGLFVGKVLDPYPGNSLLSSFLVFSDGLETLLQILRAF